MITFPQLVTALTNLWLRHEMEKKIISFLTELLERSEPLSSQTRFQELEEWNSMNTLELMSMLDEEYGVILGAAELMGFETIGAMIDYVKQRIHPK